MAAKKNKLFGFAFILFLFPFKDRKDEKMADLKPNSLMSQTVRTKTNAGKAKKVQLLIWHLLSLVLTTHFIRLRSYQPMVTLC